MAFTEHNAVAWTGLEAEATQARALGLGRAVEIAFAVLCVLALSLFFLGAALALWLEGAGPVFFAQTRIGRGGRRFHCYKFRSMIDGAEAGLAPLLAADPLAEAEWRTTRKLKRDPRVTPVGRCLRLTSLDELPQLFNVIKGDMSFVGPRPMLEGEQNRYGRFFAEYASVRPGITGLWQVSGRSDLSHHRRVALDITYVRRRSATLDLRILLATLPAVLFARGAS